MSEPIKTGDLVVVILPTPCCGNQYAVGMHFVVRDVFQSDAEYHCEWCKVKRPEGRLLALAEDCSFQIYRLKRIPPMSELEGEKRDEEITA